MQGQSLPREEGRLQVSFPAGWMPDARMSTTPGPESVSVPTSLSGHRSCIVCVTAVPAACHESQPGLPGWEHGRFQELQVKLNGLVGVSRPGIQGTGPLDAPTHHEPQRAAAWREESHPTATQVTPAPHFKAPFLEPEMKSVSLPAKASFCLQVADIPVASCTALCPPPPTGQEASADTRPVPRAALMPCTAISRSSPAGLGTCL